MKNIVKTLGFFAIIATFSGANAASPRASVMGAIKTGSASARLPSVAGYIVTGTATTGSSSSSTASLLSNSECIETYSGCLKGTDVCGPGLEECTTNVLLHAKMPNCLSILGQCSPSGVNDLFGTSSVTALAEVESTNNYGEVSKYRYPTDGSVLGQMVTGAKLSNMLTSDQCVKKYMKCLQKESVCGSDFELCTTNNEFKKQSINCASTLARCQGDGITELFGSTNTSAAPAATSRVGTAISEGAALAAVNAVSTCYKIADQCILNACGSNPNKCVVDANGVLAEIAEAISTGNLVANEKLATVASTLTTKDVSGYLKNACLETIGGNKYCYATFIGNGQMPTNAQLRDEDNREEIFDEAYAARMNNAMRQKVQDLVNKFDAKAKNKCVETIKTCAMRNCGGGLGSVCYSQVFGENGNNTISGGATYETIKTACESIVNTDSNCQYAAASVNNNMYTYTYTDNSVFKALFPSYEEEGDKDPISVIGTLNSSLSSSYNTAAISQMRKQCGNVAISCVKSLCGKDYINCYRNRTDVMSNTYDTGAAGFDKSMNKVGGVLDYTIVTGLCIGTVKNADVCEEHLKIEAFKLKSSDDPQKSSWGSGGVRDTWLGAAGSISAKRQDSNVVIGCKTKTVSDMCNENTIEACGYMDEDGCLYDQEVTETWDEYSISQSAENLFQEVLMDIEKEAQAKYNAKLTKEQNICLQNNNGGIMGNKDNGSTFMWVKLKSNKVPKNYAMKGLTTNQFVASNDLYGSFCRAKITVVSDDKNIQDNLGGDSVAYFAVGDAFTCGSWISKSTLDNISKAVGKEARKEAGEGSDADWYKKLWFTLGGTAVGGVGGFVGMDAIQKKGGTLGGLLSAKNNEYTQTEEKNEAGKTCNSELDKANSAYQTFILYEGNAAQQTEALRQYQEAVEHANKALRAARNAGGDVKGIEFTVINGYTVAKDAVQAVYEWNPDDVRNIRNAYISKIQGSDKCTADNNCKPKIDYAAELLGKAPRDATGDPEKGYIKDNINAAISILGSDAGVSTINDNLTLGVVQKQQGQAAVDAKPMNMETAKATFPTNISKLRDICTTMETAKEDTSGRRNRNLVAGGVGALAGGLLGYGITKNVLDVKYEKAENEAIAEWLEQVGSHIHCYLGGEELGSYGDVISFDVE
ncbi:MAG: hypothetical protein J6W27_00165 [Alphaproteobacteria bacterium]|nr:hypothetical protein [Alphaproteobacteria bacterium]